MNHLAKICLSLLLVLLLACQSEPSSRAKMAEPVAALTQSPPAISTPDPQASPQGASSILRQRKIIREGFISIETDDYPQTRMALSALLAQWDAFVAQENEERNQYQQSNRIQIRVPSATFEPLVQSIEDIAKIVHQKRISSKDVTEEYIDLNARIKAKRAAEERYYAFLRQAQTVEEMLQIQAPLRLVREEIESLEGRLRYLEDQTSLSTLEIYLIQSYEPEETTVIVESGFWFDVKMALYSGAAGLGDVLVGLTYLWPVWLMLTGLGLVWWRRRTRKA